MSDRHDIGATVRIQSMFEELTPGERRIAEAILGDSDAVLLASIGELAAQSQASEAAVSRFARRVGYASYAEFKLALARDHVSPRELVYEEVEVGDDVETVLAKVASANIRAIEDAVRAVVQDALAEAATRIATARRVAFFGFGGSLVAAQDALQKFMRVLGNVSHVVDSYEQTMWAALSGPGDVVVVSSHSGAVREAVERAQLATARGAFVIAISNHASSPLAEIARVNLCTAAREGRFREESLSSRSAMMTLMDALYVLVALQRPEEVAERNKLIRDAVGNARVTARRRPRCSTAGEAS